MVPADTVQKALTKANASGVVSLNGDQVQLATNAFKSFAAKTQVALIAPGTVSSYGNLLTNVIQDAAQQSAFTSLYLTQPTATDFWASAAKLKIPDATLNLLKIQGKLHYLTSNSALWCNNCKKRSAQPTRFPRS